MFNTFLNTFLKHFYNSFPESSTRHCINNNKAWISSSIKIKCSIKRHLYLNSKESNNANIKSHYKAYCRALSRDIREAKRLYYDKLIINSKNRTKTTWNIVKLLTGRKSYNETTPSLSVLSKSHINPKMIADSFNKYFLSVAESITINTPNNNNIIDICNKSNKYLTDIFINTFPLINYSYATTNEIGKIIDKLKTTNSYGYDEIPIKILKSCKHFITSPLTYIINRSLVTGIFPDRLKFSEIKPIYKNGDKNLISNYRPISLLTSFSKIFERVLFARLCHHLTNNNVLASEQFGFRPDSSTEKAINRLLDQILTALNVGQNVGVIFCDLKKAFDCVNHKILLSKLEFYGITGPMHKIIASYLTGRFQRIRLQAKDCNLNIRSSWGVISHGVPQGSILGPLLFLIYINDLPLVLNRISSPILYADDTSVIICNPDPLNFLHNVTEVFNKLDSWFNANLLSFNFSKTEFIKFKTKNIYEHATKIVYDDMEISNSSHIKFLGVNIVNTLSWKTHIDLLIPKLSSACYAIRAIKPYVNQETLLMVYYAYFHSLIDYGVIFWGNSSYAINIFRLQKRVVRIITGASNRSSCRQIFTTLKILPLSSLYIYSLLCFVVLNMDQYQFVSDVHNRDTRQGFNLNLYQPSTHLSLYQRGSYYMGIKLFNSLPLNLKQLYRDVKQFKLKIKEFLYNHSFYTLEEYFVYFN
ncbi:hypothetical protein B7P43_G08125 [Cryptotermes secundus]|uniref:Reverse transcriptase domain-containing protein n=1 Tax=Cryptotermes secundus TaxID=105785 RepID=A0A2J7PVT1_9NEOP|nr:hypothetical protein B7P43_G08125 [Cryptotermes secundus]